MLDVFICIFFAHDFIANRFLEDFISVELGIWIINDQIWQVCTHDIDTLKQLRPIDDLLVLKEVLINEVDVLSKVCRFFSKRVCEVISNELEFLNLILFTNVNQLIPRMLLILLVFVLVKHVQNLSSDASIWFGLGVFMEIHQLVVLVH